MKAKLLRVSNNNSWLWGSITSDTPFHCDTLEMGNSNQVQTGIYDLKICYTQDHSRQFVALFDKDNNFISVLVGNNNYLLHGIEIRRENNYITIGEKATECYLKHQESKCYDILVFVRKAYENGQTATLEIVNTLKSVKMK